MKKKPWNYKGVTDNLITLCKNCNIKANTNRKYWKKYYSKKILRECLA